MEAESKILEDEPTKVSKADQSQNWRGEKQKIQKNRSSIPISDSISDSIPISPTIYDGHNPSVQSDGLNPIVATEKKKQVHWSDDVDNEPLNPKVPEVPFADVPDVTDSPTAKEKADRTIKHRGTIWKLKEKSKDPDGEKVMESDIELKGKITSRIKIDVEKLKSKCDLEDLPFDPDEEEVTTFPTNAIPIEDLKSRVEVFLLVEDDLKAKLPKGALVIGDPVLQYLESLTPGEEPKQIFIAKPSEQLRCVYPLVNGAAKIESLYDTGSQIVSISEKKAMVTGLSWDPDVVIYMQSANKGVEKSLGLARNVPFLFGEVTLYMQIHVIRDPAYDLLLGRPFDTLTESMVKTTKDGNQTITIYDPNTLRRSVIVTYPRGKGPNILEKSPELTQGFLQASRI